MSLFTQVTEANSSVAMERVGCDRGLTFLLEKGVYIDTLTTDRSAMIRKLMRENFSAMKHEFDCWHVNKSEFEHTFVERVCRLINHQPWSSKSKLPITNSHTITIYFIDA